MGKKNNVTTRELPNWAQIHKNKDKIERTKQGTTKNCTELEPLNTSIEDNLHKIAQKWVISA